MPAAVPARPAARTLPEGTSASRELVLIGIGAGDPDWITLAGVRALEQLDVLFVVLKEGELDDLVEARRVLVERHRSEPLPVVELQDPPRPWRKAPDYDAAVATWRAQRLEQWTAAVSEHLGAGQTGGFLVWGDPSLYESTLAIVQKLAAAAPDLIDVRVIPGVSCVHALTAAHRVPLNRQGRAVQILPARLIAGGVPADVDDVVVMLDGRETFASIDPTGLDIYWGAYLGTPDELLISGPLADVANEIAEVRRAALERKGWVFDTYLLRRR
ncbi:precorrin-6A synthase (deacetylating) [Nigerium massiliense]|uniref:precorrin-6A synthase (deacetylating) n=1 Tax=Nigerium massiliense TaxID=1522317 RepID=UPI0006937EDB|nr:precorrin-6A synthase (deacetylating) [Nigerium massiliense]